MSLVIAENVAKKEINRCKKLSSIDELTEGDRVLMTVGTWCHRWPNNDWRWIKGYVKSVTPSETRLRTGELVPYKVYEISPVKNEILRRLFPETITIDVGKADTADPQQSPVTYANLFRYNN